MACRTSGPTTDVATRVEPLSHLVPGVSKVHNQRTSLSSKLKKTKDKRLVCRLLLQASSMRVLGILVVFGMSLLPAATLEKLSVDDMIGKSTEIVSGKVLSSNTIMRGPMIYTRYRVRVAETWKGKAASEVDVFAPGGTFGGTVQTVPGAPRLEEAQDYVLFLWTGRTGMTQVIGLSQGLFELHKNQNGEPVVSRRASRDTILDSSGRFVEDAPVSMRLREMVDRIHRMLAGVNQ
jgi:hypothetical protein